ncbi:MAG TPA: hypothetical protein VFA35_11695, partial [Burkholderiaceae bacterium]|nr:hypothetical protein [Burkholderiaceae bacterium]
SEITKAWLLYLGLIFLFMVMFAPGGVAGLIMTNLRVAAHGKLGRLLPSYAAVGLAGAVAVVGIAALVEMIYHKQLGDGASTTLNYLGYTLDTAATGSWLTALAVTVVGVLLFIPARKRFAQQWGDVQGEIVREAHTRSDDALDATAAVGGDATTGEAA